MEPMQNLVLEYRRANGLSDPKKLPVVETLWGAESEILSDPDGYQFTPDDITKAIEWGRNLQEEQAENRRLYEEQQATIAKEEAERKRIEEADARVKARPLHYNKLPPAAQQEIDERIRETGSAKADRGGILGAIDTAKEAVIEKPLETAGEYAGEGFLKGMEKYEQYIQQPFRAGMAALALHPAKAVDFAIELVTQKEWDSRADDYSWASPLRLVTPEGRKMFAAEYQNTIEMMDGLPGPGAFVASTILQAAGDPATYVPTGSAPFGKAIAARLAAAGAPPAATRTAQIGARALYEIADNGGPLMSLGMYGGAEGVSRGYWLDKENQWSYLIAGGIGGIGTATVPKAAYRVGAAGYQLGATALHMAVTTSDERLLNSHMGFIEETAKIDLDNLPEGADPVEMALAVEAGQILASDPRHQALALRYENVTLADRIDNVLGRPLTALAMANAAVTRQAPIMILRLTDAVAEGKIRPYDAAHSLALAGFMTTGEAAKHLWGAASLLMKEAPGELIANPAARALGASGVTAGALVATDDFGQDLEGEHRMLLALAPGLLGMVRTTYKNEDWFTSGRGDPSLAQMELGKALQEPNWVDRVSLEHLSELLGREITPDGRIKAIQDLIGDKALKRYTSVVEGSGSGSEFIALSPRELNEILTQNGHHLGEGVGEAATRKYYLAISTPEAQFSAIFKDSLPSPEAMRVAVREFYKINNVPEKHLKQLYAMIDVDDAVVKGGGKDFDPDWKEGDDFWWVPRHESIKNPLYEMWYNGSPGTLARHTLADNIEAGTVASHLDASARQDLIRGLRDTSKTDYEYPGGLLDEPKPAPHTREGSGIARTADEIKAEAERTVDSAPEGEEPSLAVAEDVPPPRRQRTDTESRNDYDPETPDIEVPLTQQVSPAGQLRRAEIQRTVEVIVSFAEDARIAYREPGKQQAWEILDVTYGKMIPLSELDGPQVIRLIENVENFRKAIMDSDGIDWWSTLPERERLIRFTESFGEFFEKPQGWENAKILDLEREGMGDDFAGMMKGEEKFPPEGSPLETTEVDRAYVARRTWESMGGDVDAFGPSQLQEILEIDQPTAIRVMDALRQQDSLVEGEILSQVPRAEVDATPRRGGGASRVGCRSRKDDRA
jgi:hypothetical protein